MRTSVLAILSGLAAGLMGCAADRAIDQKVETSRIVRQTPADLVPEISAFLEQRGIEVERADPDAGLIQAVQEPLERPEWAECGPLHVEDTDGERRRRAELLGRRLELDVALDRLSGQTLVSVEPAFIGVYRNSFTNLDVEMACVSSQRLERALLKAL